MNIKNQITMKKYTYTLIIIASLILSASIISNASAYTIDHNNHSVWIQGNYGKLEATPHTITQSGWVYFNITPYQSIGNIDMIWGFNTTIIKPQKAEFYNPHVKYWNTYHKRLFKNVSHIESTLDKCDYGNEYNEYKRKITYSFYNTSITKVICFDSYEVNGTDYIAYWCTNHSKFENWTDVSDEFSSVNYNYDNKNKWWYVTNFAVEPYKTYTARIWVNVPIVLGKTTGKYDFAVKRSSDSLDDAIINHRFYLLDPWFDSSYDERKNVSIECTESINYYQMNFNLSHLDIPESQADFDDVRFINVSDNTELPYWVENKVNDDWCSFWVNVTSLNAGWNNDTVAIYYGNSEVSNNSNYDTTFTKIYNKSGMVLELHIDEESGYSQTNDTSGYGNDGILNNMNLTGNDTSGWVGSDGGQWDSRSDVNFSTGDSLRFDGTDDYVDCGNDESLNITDAFTIEALVKSSVVTTQRIASKYTAYGFAFGIEGAGRAQLYIGTANGAVYPTDNDISADGEWHRIVGVREPPSFLKTTGLTNQSNIKGGHGVSWNSDGDRIAVCGLIISRITVYRYDESSETLTEVVSVQDSTCLLSACDCAFNPVGDRLAVVAKNSNCLTVYDFNKVAGTLTEVTHIVDDTYMGSVRAVVWNPTGDRIATASPDTTSIAVYNFDKSGGTLTYDIGLIDNTNLDVSYELDFNPDGDRIAVVGRSAHSVVIYNYDKTASTLTEVAKLVGTANTDLDNPVDVVFNPAGDRIAAIGYSNSALVIFTFDKETGVLVKEVSLTSQADIAGPHSLDWNPVDDRIAVAGYGANSCVVYSYNKSPSLIEIYSVVGDSDITEARGIGWNPDGNRIAVSAYNDATNGAICVFSSSKVRIYVDGMLKDTRDDFGGSLDTGANNLRIGDDARPTEAGEFNGTIDEVRIYNRALSADEMYRHYIYSKYTLNPPTYTLTDTEHYPYPPPDPINLTYDTSQSGHVIWSWIAGSGNITDSYNVSVDSIWHNESSTPRYDDAIGTGTSSIIIYAYNNNGYLSNGNVSGSQKGILTFSNIINVIEAIISIFTTLQDLVVAVVPYIITLAFVSGLILLLKGFFNKGLKW